MEFRLKKFAPFALSSALFTWFVLCAIEESTGINHGKTWLPLSALGISSAIYLITTYFSWIVTNYSEIKSCVVFALICIGYGLWLILPHLPWIEIARGEPLLGKMIDASSFTIGGIIATSLLTSALLTLFFRGILLRLFIFALFNGLFGLGSILVLVFTT